VPNVTTDPLPDLTTLSDDDLERLLRDAESEEEGISLRRRELHGAIDRLREERVVRLRMQAEAGTLDVGVPSPPSLERSIFEGTGELPDAAPEHPAVDPGSLSDDDLRAKVIGLEREEDDLSLRRRMLHGRIDILRAERERRRRGLHVDPADLGPILGGSPR
jgi:RsiG-like